MCYAYAHAQLPNLIRATRYIAPPTSLKAWRNRLEYRHAPGCLSLTNAGASVCAKVLAALSIQLSIRMCALCSPAPVEHRGSLEDTAQSQQEPQQTRIAKASRR